MAAGVSGHYGNVLGGSMAEKKMGRPTNVELIAKKRAAEMEKSAIYDQVGEGWALLISFIRWFPDFALDLLRADDADYDLAFIQRIIMRANARYKYCDIQGCRSLTKTFCTLAERMTEDLVWPGLRTAYFGPSYKQTARIAGETFAAISKNYPALAAHFEIAANGADTFEIRTQYGSVFSITASRGDTFFQTVAEEYAQEEKPPFDHDYYRAVVKKSMRGEPRLCGKRDPTYIPLKQSSITSAGRRQNRAYEIRTLHFEMMQQGDRTAFVMDVPFDVLLLLGMRDVDWAETQRNDTTPDEWARELETRNTGSDQNPVIRDETLTDSRSLLLMEEHHTCKDLDSREKPGDVIYIVAYDVSYSDGPANARCAAVVWKLTKQTNFYKRDKYLKAMVWLEDWAPSDPMRQAQRIKNLWYRFCFDGSETYLAIDSWAYGTAVLQALMMDLGDGLAPLCCMGHEMFGELELPGAIPVIYPVKAGGVGSRDPDSDMLRYAILQWENNNVQILTSNVGEAIEAYKRYHRIKDDRMDGFLYRPYQETQKFVGQVQNLKTVPSGAGMLERRLSHRIQRDYWSAAKYGLRVAQILEVKYLVKPEIKSDWDEALEKFRNGTQNPSVRRGIPNRIAVGRIGGKRF